MSERSASGSRITNRMNILGTRKIWFGLSIIIIIIGIIAISLFGFKTGIDFAGGTILEIQVTESQNPVADNKLAILDSYKESVELDVAVQTIAENRYMVRSEQLSNEQKNQILAHLRENFASVEELRFESVDPTISYDIVRKAILAIILAVLAILFYVAYSFRKIPKPLSSWRFSTAAIIALIHDMIILLGIYAIVGQYFGAEVDGLFITALLTLLGFSVHDTIVTFDRIRENLRRRAGEDIDIIINDSVVETIVRSVATSFTLLLVLMAMFFFGGNTLRFFTLALVVGVLVGTYSSIFIAAPVLLWGRSSKK